MNKVYLLFGLLLSTTFLNCKESVSNRVFSGLRMLINEELIERAKFGNFPDINTVQYLRACWGFVFGDKKDGFFVLW